MMSKKGFSICCGVMLSTLPAISVFAEGNAFDRYALPRDKRAIDACQQVALVAHPGKIQQMQPRNTSEGFQYRFEIQDREGMMWVVVCDATTQRIVTNQLIP